MRTRTGLSSIVGNPFVIVMTNYLQIVVVTLGLASLNAGPAAAAEDTDLKRVLDLLGALKYTDDYEKVKRLVPEVSPLKEDVGEEATEAKALAKVAGVTMEGEFNFSKGKLISHGFRTKEIDQAKAHALLGQAVKIMREQFGEPHTRVVTPDEHDGPRENIMIHMEWIREGARIGMSFNFTGKSWTVNWGAQAAAQPPREIRRSGTVQEKQGDPAAGRSE